MGQRGKKSKSKSAISRKIDKCGVLRIEICRQIGIGSATLYRIERDGYGKTKHTTVQKLKAILGEE